LRGGRIHVLLNAPLEITSGEEFVCGASEGGEVCGSAREGRGARGVFEGGEYAGSMGMADGQDRGDCDDGRDEADFEV
jgi:hypothetical protein